MSRRCAVPSCGRGISDSADWSVLTCPADQYRIRRFTRERLTEAFATGNLLAFVAAERQALAELGVSA